MLRDRLVCGITDGRLQQRLLAEPDLTFKKALELSQAQESTKQGAQQLQQQQRQASTSVNKLGQHRHPPPRQSAPRDKPCYHCGGPHPPAECQFKESVCHSCNKKGHIAKVCHSAQQKQKQAPGSPAQQQQGCRKSNPTHQVETRKGSGEDSLEAASYELFNLQGSRSKPLTVTLQVNQMYLLMEVDTGQLYP